MTTLGDRIRNRLDQLGTSQAALARRVKVTQPAINDLVNGRSTSSKHIHLIARELKTTVAYLMGETDDPASELPDDALSSLDREDLLLLRRLPDRDRDAVRQLMRTIAETLTPAPTPATLHSPRRSFAGGQG